MAAELWNKTLRDCLSLEAERILTGLAERSFCFLAGEPVSRDPANVHSHPELCLVLEGALDVQTRTRTHRLEPGTVLLVPPATYHVPRSAADQAVTLWLVGAVGVATGAISRVFPDGRWVALESFDLVEFRRPHELMGEMVRECLRADDGWFPMVRNLAHNLVIETRRALADAVAAGRRHDAPPANAPRLRRIALRARRFVEANYHRGLAVADVAHAVGLSENYLATLFHREVGLTINDFLTELRIQEARRLLAATDKSVAEIAYEVGYASPFYFSRLFGKRVGTTPTRYRRSQRPALG